MPPQASITDQRPAGNDEIAALLEHRHTGVAQRDDRGVRRPVHQDRQRLLAERDGKQQEAEGADRRPGHLVTTNRPDGSGDQEYQRKLHHRGNGGQLAGHRHHRQQHQRREAPSRTGGRRWPPGAPSLGPQEIGDHQQHDVAVGAWLGRVSTPPAPSRRRGGRRTAGLPTPPRSGPRRASGSRGASRSPPHGLACRAARISAGDPGISSIPFPVIRSAGPRSSGRERRQAPRPFVRRGCPWPISR